MGSSKVGRWGGALGLSTQPHALLGITDGASACASWDTPSLRLTGGHPRGLLQSRSSLSVCALHPSYLLSTYYVPVLCVNRKTSGPNGRQMISTNIDLKEQGSRQGNCPCKDPGAGTVLLSAKNTREDSSWS